MKPTKAHIIITNTSGIADHWLYSYDGETFYECREEPTPAWLEEHIKATREAHKPLGFKRAYLESISNKIKFEPIE